MEAQNTQPVSFAPVPELGYRVVPNFFHAPENMGQGEASGVALNSRGHIFLFQRVKPMLCEYDEKGAFLRAIGEGLFPRPQGSFLCDLKAEGRGVPPPTVEQ
jgi:hypothetical protein